MRALFHVALRSALNRRGTLALVMLSIALATALLLGLERLRTDIRGSFSQSVSGTDLVVGARTSPVQLMLLAVFRVGGATHDMRMDSLQAIAQHRAVAWVVPLSLGDSHRGRPVLGTTPAYFEHFAYGDQQKLVLAQGRAFAGTLDGLYEAVIGAELAQSLGYRLGQKITLSHGNAEVLAQEHADKPFTVVGVLARTGTPVDRTVHVSLQAIEAIHLDWAGGAPLPAAAGVKIAPEFARKFDLEPKRVTAAAMVAVAAGVVIDRTRVVRSMRTATYPSALVHQAYGGVIGRVGGVVGGVLDGVLDAEPAMPPRYLPNEEISDGVRVPTILVSPWVERGAVVKRRFDHASILKTILIKFCANDRPFLSDRVHHAFDLGSALTLSQPRTDQARLPDLPRFPDLRRAAAAMKPLRAVTSREITQEDSDWHEFMGVLSRQLRR